MRLFAAIHLFFAACALVLMQACNAPRNFEDEIHAIDSLNIAMDESVQLLDSAALQITDSITRQLKFIQNNFRGEMKQSMAETLLRFGNYRGKVVTIEQWKDSLHYRKDQLQNEFFALRNTLSDKATHDRLNREISELYADSVLQSLTEKQQQWHTKINEWMQQKQSVNNNWRLLNDTIRVYRESIPQRKQP